MITDEANLEPQGEIKVELKDEDGFYKEVENHNVVVNSATDIIAQALANPGGYSRVENTVTVDTEGIADAKGYYHLKEKLPFAKSQVVNISLSVSDDLVVATSGSGALEYDVSNDYTPLSGIKSAEITDGSTTEELTIGNEVFLREEDEGIISFTEDLTASYSGWTINLALYIVESSATGLIPGTEEISIAGTDYSLSTTTDSDGQLQPGSTTYGINYETGDVWFDSAKSGVEITYKYKVEQGINFMGVSDMPSSHTPGYPVVFVDDHKYKEELDDEYLDARQPLKFPAVIEKGSVDTVLRQGNGDQTVFEIPADKTPLLNLEEVIVYDGGTPIEYTIVDSLSGEDQVTIAQTGDGISTPGKVEFSTAPISSTDQNIKIDFRWDSGSTVNFVAEFAPSVPAERFVDVIETFPDADPDGDGNPNQIYEVDHEVTGVNDVLINGSSITDTYTPSYSGYEVDIGTTPSLGDTVDIDYSYLKDTFDIYEVGLFNGAGSDSSKMFSISGIGPITKDSNTGMKITWSVTF